MTPRAKYFNKNEFDIDENKHDFLYMESNIESFSHRRKGKQRNGPWHKQL